MFDFFDSTVIIDTPSFRVVKRWDGSYAYGCGAEQTTELSDLLKECFLNTPAVIKTLPDGFVYLIECPAVYSERFLTVITALVDDMSHIAPMCGEGE